MKYTQIPSTTFQNIQLNAGVVVDSFNPETGVIGNIFGATTGGINFKDDVEYKDFGEDIDNCPKNTKELKKVDSHSVSMSGTFVTLDANTGKVLVASADVDEIDPSHIIPRNDIEQTDFIDLWWVGDYSDKNTGDSAGFCAIHLMNALNTGGFQIQSTDKAKGQFAFEFTGHYSIENQDTVPYEIYIREGDTEIVPAVLINKHVVTVYVDDTVKLTARTLPSGETVTWSSDDTTTATVTSGGIVEGKVAGDTIITATITVDGVDYSDTCTVIVETAPEPEEP